MTGSLQIKNGKYYMVLNYNVNGKRTLKWISTHLPVKGNKTQATRMLRDTIIKYEAMEQFQGCLSEASQITTNSLFSEVVTEWLNHVKPKIDEITFQGYQTCAKTHVIPYFESKGIKVKSITAQVLQEYFNYKHTCGRVDGKGGLSGKSLLQHKNIISQSIDYAAKNGCIPYNPCSCVELPKVKQHDWKFYTSSQISKLLEVSKGDVLFPIIKVASIYGLRRSEILGLKWDCVNFEDNIFTIKRTVVKVTKTVEKDSTKNESSRRSFPMSDEIVALFKNLQECQTYNKEIFANGYIDTDYVFTWPDGHTISPDYVSQHFASILKHNNLPHIRFHELRHSSASNLLSMGYGIKDVQEWLGHSDIKVTANIYGHLDAKRKIDLANALTSSFQ